MNFEGWSNHALDAKGRLAIPARFRDILRASGDERLVITTLPVNASDRCLVAYPHEQWRIITEKISHLSPLDPKVQAFRRIYISPAVSGSCDGQGRILIPQPLREWAELKNQVILVGMQANFEIWDKDRHDQYQALTCADFSDLSAYIAETGI